MKLEMSLLHGQYLHYMSLMILQQKEYLEEMLNGNISIL